MSLVGFNLAKAKIMIITSLLLVTKDNLETLVKIQMFMNYGSQSIIIKTIKKEPFLDYGKSSLK